MYSIIPQDTFDELQVDAGMILSSFNPASPSISQSDVITATTGGVTVECKPTFTDYGEDVDNVPNNAKEMKVITGWDCKLSTTALSSKMSMIRLALGAADVNATTGAITPRKLKQSDFADIWWVGLKGNDGFIAAKISNALSTAGYSLKTTKNGKGQLTVELTGHVSINDVGTVPMVFYSIDPYSVTNTLTHVTNSNEDTQIGKGDAYSGTLTADSGYTMGTVTVTMGGTDITSTAYTSGTGAISIASVTGNIVITATATK